MILHIADLVVGTSSGATAAAHVRSGIPPAELLASVLSPPVQPVGQNREVPPSLPMATVFERMRAIGAAATSAADLQREMGAFGMESDSIPLASISKLRFPESNTGEGRHPLFTGAHRHVCSRELTRHAQEPGSGNAPTHPQISADGASFAS